MFESWPFWMAEFASSIESWRSSSFDNSARALKDVFVGFCRHFELAYTSFKNNIDAFRRL